MNPAIGSVVKYKRADGLSFFALVLSDEGPGVLGIAYVDTTATPPFVATVNPVPFVVVGSNGFVTPV